jgi:hypothetical protein
MHKFVDQQARWIDRARHLHLTLGHALEAELGVIRFVADQQHQFVTFGAGPL